ncbi:hypothetical protein EYF80_020720 [Liparis tanakae]|uniref:Uncharacterized protein n=1 Tax=Liparis tanakae TaxID=230148 RepID=A0A4Z2HTL0_9TELE|nr:hypothetical protein EYF80_020720 [Liparis tanakae]
MEERSPPRLNTICPKGTTGSPCRGLQYLLVEKQVRLTLRFWTPHWATPSPHQIPQSHLYMQEMGNMENSAAEQGTLKFTHTYERFSEEGRWKKKRRGDGRKRGGEGERERERACEP